MPKSHRKCPVCHCHLYENSDGESYCQYCDFEEPPPPDTSKEKKKEKVDEH